MITYVDEKPRLSVTIECDEPLTKDIGEYIHNQLRGNQDYIDNNIILNIDEPGMVKLWVFAECKDIPKIILPDIHYRHVDDYKYLDGTEKIVPGKAKLEIKMTEAEGE